MNSFTKSLIVVLLFCFACSAFAAEDNIKVEFKPIVDDPALPRVLLIGDSISIGYTLPVRELLKGKANVHRPPTNCGPTTKGIESIDDWLGDGNWDVIHFNWGLHDLKFPPPTSPDKGDDNAVPIKEYRQNLSTLVRRMKETGATLVSCLSEFPPTRQNIITQRW
jgi:acyl-CoA thioesterase-1